MTVRRDGLTLRFTKAIDGWEIGLRITGHFGEDGHSALIYSAEPTETIMQLWQTLERTAFQQRTDNHDKTVTAILETLRANVQAINTPADRQPSAT